MATVKGQHLRLFLDNKVIAASRSCTLKINVQFSDVSTKDTDDDWVENAPTNISWSVDFEALVVRSDVNANTPQDLFTDIKGKTPLFVEIATAGGSSNRTAGQGLFSGSAILTDVNVQAPNRESSVITGTLTGISELHLVAPEHAVLEGYTAYTYQGSETGGHLRYFVARNGNLLVCETGAGSDTYYNLLTGLELSENYVTVLKSGDNFEIGPDDYTSVELDGIVDALELESYEFVGYGQEGTPYSVIIE